MPDKQQHTAVLIHEKMLLRYDDGLRHKHSKLHVLSYRKHCRSHPGQKISNTIELKNSHKSTGIIHERNLQKLRKRFDKGHYH